MNKRGKLLIYFQTSPLLEPSFPFFPFFPPINPCISLTKRKRTLHLYLYLSFKFLSNQTFYSLILLSLPILILGSGTNSSIFSSCPLFAELELIWNSPYLKVLKTLFLVIVFGLIMDLNTKGSETEDMGDTSPSKFNEFRKRCTDCQTTRTPCWRSGPAGPGTLCNACGIRLRKKRRAILGLDKGRVSEISNKKIAKSSNNNNNKLGVSLKLGLMGFRSDGLLQEDWRWKMGEEEQAAILLMALSCGSVCAASR